MADNKLTNHGDRVRVLIECGACGSDSQVSGDTFAEVEEKLNEENGFEMTDLGVLGKCPKCDSIGDVINESAWGEDA